MAKDEIDDFFDQAQPVLKWVWRGAALFLTLSLGIFSFTDVEPGEAACKVNNLTGNQESITQPGWTSRIPFIHSVYIEDASPQTFTMTGDETKDRLHTKALTVRASDGAEFWFDSSDIIFQLQGDRVCEAIADAGAENGYRRWMIPYARSVMRDEFGRESTINVSDPSKYAVATSHTSERLNEVLGEHAITVNQLVTPKPRFNEQYEVAIEQRNSLENQKEVIKSNLDRAGTERDRALAVVDQEKNLAMQKRRAELENDLATATADQAGKKRSADTAKIMAAGEGQAHLSAQINAARELEGQLAAQYVSRKAEIDAFRTQPIERVMERLGEKLKGTTIHIEPYADDASPTRLNLGGTVKTK